MQKRVVFIAVASLLFSFPLHAQTTTAEDEAAADMQKLQELRDEDTVKAAVPLNRKIDYIAGNYDENDLKLLIKNFEKTNRGTAQKQGKEYVPYDRRIDVNNPEEVKRFLRHRVDIIF